MDITLCGRHGHYTVWTSWTLYRVDIMDITPCKHYGHYTVWILYRLDAMGIVSCNLFRHLPCILYGSVLCRPYGHRTV